MNFVALLLGLGVERLLTHFFHLREFRWLDPVFDRTFQHAAGKSRPVVLVIIGLVSIAVTLPVIIVAVILAGEFLQIPFFLFSVVVLLFSLGPRDLKQEVDDYCEAAENGSSADLQRLARELLETDPPADESLHASRVERAVFIQANNRIFGVVFWFVLLGPVGAWWFRVLDSMRRRLSFRSTNEQWRSAADPTIWAVRTLHGIFAWIPARLVAVGYALAGSFEQAIAGWRGNAANQEDAFFEVNNTVLEHTGRAAIGGAADANVSPTPAVRVRTAWDLVFRTLWLIWCPVFAILTLYNWMV